MPALLNASSPTDAPRRPHSQVIARGVKEVRCVGVALGGTGARWLQLCSVSTYLRQVRQDAVAEGFRFRSVLGGLASPFLAPPPFGYKARAQSVRLHIYNASLTERKHLTSAATSLYGIDTLLATTTWMALSFACLCELAVCSRRIPSERTPSGPSHCGWY